MYIYMCKYIHILLLFIYKLYIWVTIVYILSIIYL
jgi:hypothetical protein